MLHRSCPHPVKGLAVIAFRATKPHWGCEVARYFHECTDRAMLSAKPPLLNTEIYIRVSTAGYWSWADQSPVQYTQWGSSQPANITQADVCAYINYDKGKFII